MKRWMTTVAVLTTMLVAAAPAMAQQPGAAAPQYDDGGTFIPGKETIRSHVTEIGNWYIRVQRPDNAGESTAQIWVSESTEILWQDGTQATFGDLRVGQYIELTFTGRLDECPPSVMCTAEVASASKIVILDDNLAEPIETTVQGSILDLLEGVIRVSEDSSLSVDDPGYCEKTYDFTLTEGTEILRQQNEELVPANADDFRIGQSVEVTYSYPPDGAVAAICPVQLPADKIVILSEVEPNDLPDQNSGNYGSPRSDSEDGPTLLPDTGGVSLPVMGAAVLMFLGLLARRLVR